MKRVGLALFSVLAIGSANWACSSGGGHPADTTGTGGEEDTGGNMGSTGGKTGTGGSTATGGSSPTGGAGGGGDTGGASGGGTGGGGGGGDTGGAGGSTGGAGGGGDTGGAGGSTGGAGGASTGGAGGGGAGGSQGGAFTLMLMGMDMTMAHAGGPVFTPAMSNTSNMSPAMMWSGEPNGTKSFAISMIDTQTPTAPSKTPPLKPGTSNKAHWVIYNIPASAHALPADLPNAAMLPDPMGAFASATFASKAGGGKSFGYFGPGGAPSVYRLTLYALDVETLPGIAAGAAQMSTADALRTGGNLASHVLAKTEYLAAGTNGGFK
jgi:phosphatidylethanolamine-binding protein (PEBP) family uncharacterized protein